MLAHPCCFEGVRVGSVIDIDIVADPVKEQTEIPVVIKVELDRFKVRIAGQFVDPQKICLGSLKKAFGACYLCRV